MRIAPVALIGLAVACGGSSSSPAPAPPPQSAAPLNPSLNGTWKGVSTTEITGFDPQVNNEASLDVAVSGTTAAVSRICPDDTGTVMTSGSGNSLAWSGRFQCPPLTATCGAVTLAITSVTATLGAANTLAAAGTFDGTACGQPVTGKISFSGVK